MTIQFRLGRNHREAPVFKVFAELAIPNVTIHPSTDEVQGYLQKAVHTIVSVAKNISQWNKDRQRVNTFSFLLMITKHSCRFD